MDLVQEFIEFVAEARFSDDTEEAKIYVTELYFTERENAIPGSMVDTYESLVMNLYDMFYWPLAFVQERIEKEHEKRLEVIIDASLDGNTISLICDMDKSHIVHSWTIKAWHYQHSTKEEFNKTLHHYLEICEKYVQGEV